MDDVEAVAVWAGLFAAIAGIVLALVAIWFASRVDSRAHELDRASLQRLERIEVSVDRVVSDVRQLIVSAWERIVVSRGQPDVREAAGEGAQAPASQVEEHISDIEQALPPAEQRRLEDELAALRDAVRRLEQPAQYKSPRVYWEILKPDDLALLKIMLESGQHISPEEAEAVVARPRALMREGLLVPVIAADGQRVYWLTELATDVVASLGSGTAPRKLLDSISRAEDYLKPLLAEQGYPVRSEEGRKG